MKVIAKKDFILNGTPYMVNKTFEVEDKKILVKLANEGFIYPVIEQGNGNETPKKKIKKEDEKNDRRYHKN